MHGERAVAAHLHRVAGTVRRLADDLVGQRCAGIDIGTVELAGHIGEGVVGRRVHQGWRADLGCDGRRIIGAGDREGDILYSGIGGAVIDLDGVSDGQALTGGEEVKVCRTRIIAVADVHRATIGSGSGQREGAAVRQGRRPGREREVRAIELHDRTADDAGRQRVADIGIAHREVARDGGNVLRRGIDCFQHSRRIGRIAQHRTIVRAGDGHRHCRHAQRAIAKPYCVSDMVDERVTLSEGIDSIQDRGCIIGNLAVDDRHMSTKLRVLVTRHQRAAGHRALPVQGDEISPLPVSVVHGDFAFLAGGERKQCLCIAARVVLHDIEIVQIGAQALSQGVAVIRRLRRVEH